MYLITHIFKSFLVVIHIYLFIYTYSFVLLLLSILFLSTLHIHDLYGMFYLGIGL